MNRIILLEGLPGTGKTTNSYMLFEQLVRNGRDVRWLHEVSQPHPTLFFSESCLTKEGSGTDGMSAGCMKSRSRIPRCSFPSPV